MAIAKRAYFLGLLVLVLAALFMPSTFGAVRTFVVEENELVRLRPIASDPDQDRLSYSYSPPLNEDGEWQTGYDDAGTYDITITASDGEKSTTQKVILVVKNVNRAPVLMEKKIVVKEKQEVDLTSVVSDPDGDALSFTFAAPFDRNGKWKTNYGDEGTRVASFTVSDGETELSARVEVQVLPSNKPPEIVGTFSSDAVVELKEDSVLHFWVNAQDSEELFYTWELDGKVVAVSPEGKHHFNFFSAGEHELKVAVSDKLHLTEKAWHLRVGNVNRKPELTILPVTVYEGQKLKLNVPRTDVDGDQLEYSYEQPLSSAGEWQTNFEDAGNYKVSVQFTDGEFEDEEVVEITVINVDRTPVLTLPSRLDAREGELVRWQLLVSDPDGDELELSGEGLPEGARLEGGNATLTFIPSYDMVRRSGSGLSNLLNRLRLEHLFLSPKDIPVSIIACGGELCTNASTLIRVKNVNRAPLFSELVPLSVQETEQVKVSATAFDPDGDIVHYYFTSPLSKSGGEWKTDFDDEGVYTVYVTATDGHAGNTYPLEVIVRKNNRVPTLKIEDDTLTVNEGQQFAVAVNAADPDGDDIDVTLEAIPPGASFKDGLFLWEPSYDTVQQKTQSVWQRLLSRFAYWNKKMSKDKAIVWLSFSASDGEMSVTHPVKVTVKNVNQWPVVGNNLATEHHSVKVGEPIQFDAGIVDPDNEALNYEWTFGWGQGKVNNALSVERTFSTTGTKKVHLRADDGYGHVEKEWIVEVLPADEQETLPPPVAFESPKPSVKAYVIKS